MDLQFLWFLIVGVFLIGYFVLDGFDFGVGIALPFVSKDDTDRRVVVNTIGPVWDLNETWLIVAGASLFAAFPEWYASLFSGFYLALLLILVALILRGVSFEYRHQGKHPKWTKWFDSFIFIGSALPALLWGVAFANLIQGVPLEGSQKTGWIYTGNFFDLLNPYALLAGATTLMLFFTYGLVYLALKADGEVRERSRALSLKTGLVTLVLAAAFIAWTVLTHLEVPQLWLILALALVTALSLVVSMMMTRAGRDGWAFVSNLITVVGAVGFIYFTLFPNLIVNSLDPANSVTYMNASSSETTLTLMTWVAVFMVPIVLAYQAWTFWVFRKRVSRSQIPAAPPESALQDA